MIYLVYIQFFIVALAIIGLAAAAEKDGEATLVDGSEKVAEYFTNTGYDYKFKTSNSIIKEEIADVDKNIVTGSYEYVSPEGKQLIVNSLRLNGLIVVFTYNRTYN